MARPVLLPEPFSGESGISRWDEWIEHFEDCAAVNKWDSDEEKLKWIRVRLTGKAHTAYRRLAQDARTKYGECKDALRRRFHPDSSRDLHMAELQVRKRQNDEDWASFGDALRVLADKAYPDLEEKARLRLKILTSPLVYGRRVLKPWKQLLPPLLRWRHIWGIAVSPLPARLAFLLNNIQSPYVRYHIKKSQLLLLSQQRERKK